MDNNQIIKALQLARTHSKKRNFSQTFDLIVNLKGINIKKQEENINSYVALPHPRGKESKIVAFVGDESINKAKSVAHQVIHKDNFQSYQQKPKEIKKLAKKTDFFIAQANLMPDIAKYFGKALGPTGKMPNPKAGAVFPPIIPDLKPIVEKLKKTVKIQTKNEPTIKCPVGIESMQDNEIAENIAAIYNSVVQSVKDEKQNIKNAIIKLSMGKPIIIGKKYSDEELSEKKEKPEKVREKKQKKASEESSK